ncbi:hypothetical protein [Cupriavidus pauculus]|uniref:hypothetical protein n=1 Tax=Cupriavidus pauculus TaxID=82633 RepID=UPI00168B92C0|nr:hypothetical protein [Cupriavidus pauculus]
MVSRRSPASVPTRAGDLLDAAGLTALPRSRCKQLIVAVRARDGYTALIRRWAGT